MTLTLDERTQLWNLHQTREGEPWCGLGVDRDQCDRLVGMGLAQRFEGAGMRIYCISPAGRTLARAMFDPAQSKM